MDAGLKLSSDIKFYNDYSKYIEDKDRHETWEESVDRVMSMHEKNPRLKKAFENETFCEYFEFARQAYKEKLFLASQRSLQFGGDPILKHNAKMYNCLTSYCDRLAFFQECMYWLLCGCGVGFSVQKHHIDKLPGIQKRMYGTKTFVVPDSIEGWSDAFGILMSSFAASDPTFPEYQGYVVHFDLSLIRPEGSYISGGFKAPGPEGLRKALLKAEQLLDRTISDGNLRIRPIVAYDFVMHMSDAVLSGGVRRSATICLFSLDDSEMMSAKTGNWFYENPQRARSNNSAVLLRNKTTREQFNLLIQKAKQFGEPGFVWVDDLEVMYNPCVEIGMYPQTRNGRSGWQGCNLTEINGSMCDNREIFLRACKASAIMGTIQATYTDFKYVAPESKEIFEYEALLGCSVTGWMNNPKVLFNVENQKDGAKLILDINLEMAYILDINPAARATCTKPSGNSSVLLMTASGIHGEHDEMFFRVMQMNKNEEVAHFLEENYPTLLEESVWSESRTDWAVFFPIKAKKGSIYKKDLLGVKQLEYVKLVQQNWVEYGTRAGRCIKPYIRHNVSNTITVDNWDEVESYIWDNRQYFAGISFMANIGDKAFKQAPFTSVYTAEKIIEQYGPATLFASGLIVDALHYFDDNLVTACDHIIQSEFKIEGTRSQVLLKKDWIRRAKQFARRYFTSLEEMTFCLKDVNNHHKWLEINRSGFKNIDISTLNLTPKYAGVDTLGAMSCAGGACELVSL